MSKTQKHKSSVKRHSKTSKNTNKQIGFTTKASNSYSTHILPEITPELIKSYFYATNKLNSKSLQYAKNDNFTKKCLDKIDTDPNFKIPKYNSLQIKEHYSLNTSYFYYYLQYIFKQKLSNYLAISSVFPLIDSLVEHDIKPDLLYFHDNDIPSNIEKNHIARMTKTHGITVLTSKLQDLIQKMPEKPKYDNIIIKLSSFYSKLYLPTYMLSKFPAFLSSIVRGISELKQGGRLFLFQIIGLTNPAYEWLYNFLSEMFENIVVVRDPMSNYLCDTTIMLDCQRLKHELTDEQKAVFLKLATESLYKYNYQLCDVVVPEKVPVIDTINLTIPGIKPSQESNLIIYQLRALYISQINEICYNIKRYFKDPAKPDAEYIEKVNRFRMSAVIDYFEAYNIPYNKSYRAYIDKFDKSIINNLYSYTKPLVVKMIKYNKTPKLPRLGTGTYNPGPDDEFINLNNLAMLSFKIKNELLGEIKGNKMPLLVKQISDSFARGVVRYINEKYEKQMQHPVMNSFVKLWELYTMFPWFMAKSNPKYFFIAEAPGQWIHTTKLYAKTLGKTIDWVANSLNPKYSPTALKDAYGFIKNNPEKWIWGADNTGDLFNIENHRWYRDYAHKIGPVDIITGDAGMDVANLFPLQKLDFAQVVMVLGCLGQGGGCVIKHFLPFIREIPESNLATGFFIQLMYLYYLTFNEVYFVKPMSSSLTSGEFYVVARGYRPITDEFYEDLLTQFDKHKTNDLFMNMDDIPQTFVIQLTDFIKKLTDMIIFRDEQTNFLLTCMLKKDAVIESKTGCSQFLNPDYIKTLQDEQFRNWVKEHKFQPGKIEL
jgi:hypothetical protein